MKKSTIRGALALCLVFAMIALGACSSGGGKLAKWKEEESFQGIDLSEYVTLGEYKGMEITVLSEDVEDQVMRTARQELHTKSDKTTVEKGDVVIFDFEGTANGISEDILQGMKAEKATLVVGDNGFIPGFEEQIVGQTVGKAFDVEVTFPRIYEQEPELAGKGAVFHCTVHEIHEVDLTDAKVKEVMGGEYETLEAFYADARAYFAQPIQQQNLEQGGSAAMEAAFGNATVTGSPETELAMYQEIIKAEAAAEKQELEEYLTAVGLDPENWVSQMEEQLHWEMFVFTVAQKEDLVATEEEMNSFLERQLNPEDPSITADSILEQIGGKNMLQRGLTQDKVMSFLYENAKKTVGAAVEETHTSDDGHVH